MTTLHSPRSSRRFKVVLATAMALLCPLAGAQETSLPPTVKIIVPFLAGGSNDLVARILADQLGPRLNRTVIVENKAGASGFIGAAAVANAKPDGGTLLTASLSLVTAAVTMKKPPIDILKDLTPVAIVGEGGMVFVVPSQSPIKTPADLVAMARTKSDAITHGTAGIGTIAHMAVELLNDSAKIKLKHIPYKGGQQAMNDVLGGTIDFMVGNNAPLEPFIASGHLRRVAVTSAAPSATFPGVPTMASVVPGYHVEQWIAIFAPAGVPDDVLQRLNREIRAIAQSKKMSDVFRDDGARPVAATPAEAAARIRQEYATWKNLATTRNIDTN